MQKTIDIKLKRAIKIMEDHYVVTGLNLYFRNALYRSFNTDISYLSKKLEQEGHVKKIYVKGAVAYKLTGIKDEVFTPTQ